MERAVRCFRRRWFHAREEIGKVRSDQIEAPSVKMFPESETSVSGLSQTLKKWKYHQQLVKSSNVYLTRPTEFKESYSLMGCVSGWTNLASSPFPANFRRINTPRGLNLCLTVFLLIAKNVANKSLGAHSHT